MTVGGIRLVFYLFIALHGNSMQSLVSIQTCPSSLCSIDYNMLISVSPSVYSKRNQIANYCPKDSIFPMQRPSKECGSSVPNPPAPSLQQAHSQGALFIRAGQRTAPGMFTSGGGNPFPTAFKSFRQDENGTIMTACEMKANIASLHPRLSIAAKMIIKAARAW